MHVRPFLPMRALLLTGAALAAVPAAMAQDQATVPVVSTSGTATDDDIDYADEIVVTAPRIAGQLDTDIAAEAELDEAAIASYGASSIEELLTALEPITRSGRGRGSGRTLPGRRRAWSRRCSLRACCERSGAPSRAGPR